MKEKTSRFTSKAKLGMTDSILGALALMEKHERKLRFNMPPLLFDEADPIDLGALFGFGGPSMFAPMELIIMGYPKAGSAQVESITTRMTRNGCVVRLSINFANADGLSFKRPRVYNVAWRAKNDVSITDEQGELLEPEFRQYVTTSVQLAVGVAESLRTHFVIYFGLGRAAVGILATVGAVRRLLADRERYGSRRSALKHWVDHAFRGPSTEDDAVWVRKHMRGGISCEWGGFDVVIAPPTDWVAEHDHWRDARAVYAQLPPEERAAWRDAIRSAYAPLSHWRSLATS